MILQTGCNLVATWVLKFAVCLQTACKHPRQAFAVSLTNAQSISLQPGCKLSAAGCNLFATCPYLPFSIPIYNWGGG